MLPCRSCRWKAPDGPIKGAIDIQGGLCSVHCRHDWGAPGKSYTWIDPDVGLTDCSGYEHAKVYRGRKCSEPPHEVAVVEPWSGSSDRLRGPEGVGFDWGVGAKDLNTLASSILADAMERLYSARAVIDFRHEEVAMFPDEFEFPQRNVLEWVDEWEKRDKEPHKKGVTERKPLSELQSLHKIQLEAEAKTADQEWLGQGWRDWLKHRSEISTEKIEINYLSPITSKNAFILGVTAGALARNPGPSGWKEVVLITTRACHVKASVFDSDDKDALCRKAQEFLAWYYGTGPSEMPEWLEWEGEDG